MLGLVFINTAAMKSHSVFWMAFMLLAGDVWAQRVGVGTTAPISKLSIDSGLNIDQANVNSIALESALTFGNNKKVGIGSRRTVGTNQAGLDFYTQGSRRMVIDSFGNVGIGTTTPDRRLHVEGSVYSASYLIASFGIAAGIGNVSPSYDLHTVVGYFTTRVGIGTVPNSSYALDVDQGAVRFREAVRIDGTLNPNNPLIIGNNTTIEGTLNPDNPLTIGDNTTIQGTLTVQSNRGIVRSNTSAQLKVVRTEISLSATGLAAGSFVDSGDFGFSTFSETPDVYVGNFVSGTGSWQRLQFIPFDVDTNSCKFRVFNHGSTTATGTATYTVLLIGVE